MFRYSAGFSPTRRRSFSAARASTHLGDMTGPCSLYSPAVLPPGASMDRSCDLIELTVSLVGSFVSHNTVTAAELPTLIKITHATLAQLPRNRACSQTPRVPAVSIDKSITRDYIVCLDDGRQLKTLRRYLMRKYFLTPDEYRERWGLPDDYPMVAPGYSELRSSLATRFAKKSRKG